MDSLFIVKLRRNSYYLRSLEWTQEIPNLRNSVRMLLTI